MISFLLTGVILGLSAGLSPGPLLTLVITETIRHDRKAGIKVALAPVITDLPIIIVTFFLLAKLSGFQHLLALISLAGGVFILFLGIRIILPRELDIHLKAAKPQSVWKGVLVNVLSPHPYLFWLTVGAPIMKRAWGLNPVAPLAFAGGFYACLVGSKILLAVLAGKSKKFLTGRLYRYAMRTLGLALCGLALMLFREGFRLF